MPLKNDGFSASACGMTSRSASRPRPMTSTRASGVAAYRIHSAV